MSLRLVLAWVCDPAFGRAKLQSRDEDVRYWSTLGLCVEKATQIRDRLEETAGSSVGFTWLVRCDPHTTSLHGNPAWCLTRFSATWSRLQAEGDSLGWVFYTAVQKGNGWAQIYADGARPTELLAESHGAYKGACGEPEALFMGWHGHSQATMQQAAELGIAVDLSAIPGWYTIRRLGVAPPVGACDWEITPNAPYYPSAVDYRRPIVYPSEPAQRILESPWTLGAADRRRLQKSFADLFKPGSLGIRRNYRRRRGVPIRIGFSLPEFQRVVTPMLEKAEREAVTLTVLCQVAELAPYRYRSRSDVAEANLVWLAAECRSRGLSFAASPPRELRKTLIPSNFSKPIVPQSHGAHEGAHQH